MAEFFQQLLEWVNANPGWAGVSVFIIAFAESLAIVGVIVPGVAILFGVGALIGAGALDFWSMVSWAVAGAVLGDGLSYWLGRRFQTGLTSMWPFDRHPESLEKGILFFDKYGGKSVALGRFFGPIRAIIPLVAGMMNMQPSRFLVANVLSALAWAPIYLLPGMVFGASLELASQVAGRLALLLILLLMIMWFLGWLSHRLFILAQPHTQSMLGSLLQLGKRNSWLENIAGALADPDHPEASGLAMFAALLVLTSLALILLSLLPAAPISVMDDSIRLAMRELATPAGNQLMWSISALANNSFTLAALVTVWAVLALSGMPLAARHWLVGIGIVWLICLFGEYLLRINPTLINSVPDIYVLRAVTLYPLAAVITAGAVNAGKRWYLYSTATIIIFAVTLAQLYHGSHFSMVLNSLFLGVIWTTAISVAYRTHSHKEVIAFRPAGVVGLALTILGLSSALGTHPPAMMPPSSDFTVTLEKQNWLLEEWKKLPADRDDVTHIKRHPLNVQYAGNVKNLEDTLIDQGWSRAKPEPGLNWLRLLSPNTPIEELPILPHSHDGRYESHQFIKGGDDKRYTLYLWPSRFLIKPGEAPLWIGSAGSQSRKQAMGLVSYPVTEEDHQSPLNILQQDLLTGNLTLKEINSGQTLLIHD